MGISANGVPYPEPTDPVTQGAAAMKAIVDALDPPWVAPAMGSGWVALSAYPARYRIVGTNRLELSGTAYYAGGVPVLSTVMTLPRGSTADDTAPYAAGAQAPVTGLSGTWTAANGYLDIRTAGALVCHVVTTGAGLVALHLDGVTFRLK